MRDVTAVLGRLEPLIVKLLAEIARTRADLAAACAVGLAALALLH